MPEKDFERLQRLVRCASFTPEEREEQRRSFAFGNANFHNATVTRAMVDQVAVALEKGNGVGFTGHSTS